jgi:prepilin-type N-terminal cleavage/methylation domain-containing protein
MKSGFTLIELSMALVIIGLLVGGVLSGTSLIEAARIRATVKQAYTYDAALNAFRGKYNALPGDLTTAEATKFGFAPTSRNVVGGYAERGDGLIGFDIVTVLTDESFLFWQDLSTAKFIPNTFNSAIVGASYSFVNGDNSRYFPAAKLSNAHYWIPFSDYDINYYFLGIPRWSSADVFNDGGITPIQAYNIDVKMDDGNPVTGRVLSDSYQNGGGQYIPIGYRYQTDCVSYNAYGYYYITTNTAPNCYLNIKMLQ